MRATFVDFEDSFSFNVVQELTLIGFEVTVTNWKDFEVLPSDDLLVLGPGPGHPDDYERIFPLIDQWLQARRPFFGVCLGHQIFWRLRGEQVSRSKFPLHGQKVLLALTEDWRLELKIPGDVFVQRYNSLAVNAGAGNKTLDLKNFIQDGEILITRGNRLLTYQFHPESIGTSYRRRFFNAVCSILSE